MRLATALSIAIIAASSAAIAQVTVPQREEKAAGANNTADPNANEASDAGNGTGTTEAAAPVEAKPN